MRAQYLGKLDAFLRYLNLGSGVPARVYVHGLGLSSSTLVPVAVHPALAGRRSLVVDLLGFGLSDKPETFAYSVEEHAGCLIELLDALGLTSCELVGHSSGGSIAIVVASQRPDLISALVVAEANLDPGAGPFSGAIMARSEDAYVNEAFAADLERVARDLRADPLSHWAIMAGTMAAASPRAMYRTARSLTGDRAVTFRELLLGLDMPTSFVVGSRTLEAEEKPASGEAGEGLEGTGVNRVVVPDAGHLMMFDNLDGFAHAIARALPPPASTRAGGGCL